VRDFSHLYQISNLKYQICYGPGCIAVLSLSKDDASVASHSCTLFNSIEHNDFNFFYILYWFEEKKEHYGQRRTLRTTVSDPQLTTNLW
ncbi:MAG TPA: hypothetical protein VFU29_16425, partial [Chitinophagaceae bacterium]|nr:hypothetical protein [Chitinophagaceae bacterium]